MSDTPESPNAGSSPWVGSTGFPGHPTSPIGGGGPGNFVTGNRTAGAPGNDSDALPHPLSPLGRNHLLVQNDVDALHEKGVALDTNVPVGGSSKPNPPPATKVEKIDGAKRQTEYEDIQIKIEVKADGVDSQFGAGAGFKVSPSTLVPKEKLGAWAGTDKKVTSFAKQSGANVVAAPKGTKLTFRPTVTLQIIYGDKENAKKKSAYGRGTTAADVANNDTSLGFHENCHLQHALTFLKDDSKLPKFTGKFGDSEDDFMKAIAAWEDAVKEYWSVEEAGSKSTVDEVGSPTLSSYVISNPGHKH